jgi:ribosomal protein S12 methylthiotransferase
MSSSTRRCGGAAVGKVHLVSLGCPKNLVDSEKLLKRLGEKGHKYCSNAEDSDIIMVNTCGFVEDAKRESIEEILRLAASKKGNKRLLVLGCLAQRFGDDLRKEIPEIDALWGVGKEDHIAEYCERNVPPSVNPPLAREGDHAASSVGRFIDAPYAYLKIAEGCDRNCSYCVIPGIRGRFRSRPPDEILAEAENLIRAGSKEIIVVAQDITSYGKDIAAYDLSRLVRDIASINGDFWVRLLYLYPTSVDDRLIETIALEEKVCKYIDMPLQHASTKVLKLMGRGGSAGYYEKLITRIRSAVPDVIIRTTFIVGFPQETEEDFRELEAFVCKVEFDRLGVFTYSKEEGTPSSRLKGQVPARTKSARYERLMASQSGISMRKNKRLVGRTFRCIVDEVSNDIAIARISSQAPEIDGVVFVEDRNAKKGEFVTVEITTAYDYDLKGILR